jgi:hypothetical protein
MQVDGRDSLVLIDALFGIGRDARSAARKISFFDENPRADL